MNELKRETCCKGYVRIATKSNCGAVFCPDGDTSRRGDIRQRL